MVHAAKLGLLRGPARCGPCLPGGEKMHHTSAVLRFATVATVQASEAHSSHPPRVLVIDPVRLEPTLR